MRRAEEVREIGRRLVRNLTRTPFRSFAGLPEGAVLISEALRPSDAALLDPSRLAGVATEEGGAEGHTSVMLRALGVPAVLGAAGLAHAIRPGDVAVVDGSAGTVVLNPGCADAGRRAAGSHRLCPRAAALRQAAPSAGRDAGRRDGRTAGQSGTAARTAADRPVGRAGHRSAANRVPVHEPRNGPGRGYPDGNLPHHRRGDGRRSGGDPGAGLGRREGHRGTVERRHCARRRRCQPGAWPARHPAAAARDGTAGDSARRNPARRHAQGRCG